MSKVIPNHRGGPATKLSKAVERTRGFFRPRGGGSPPKTKPGDKLTTRQREIRDWVKAYVLSKGYGPSIREICEQFNVSSTNGIACHLKALKRKGAMFQATKDGRAMARAWVFPAADTREDG